MRALALMTAMLLAACGDSGSDGNAREGDDAGSDAAAPGGDDGPNFSETRDAIETYGEDHPGADGDVVAKTDAQLADDPEADELRSLCGEGQAPVIPQLAWEYGGSDHAWIDYQSAALVYCVYTPVDPSTDHWEYDAEMDHVTADVYVLFPDDNPCRDETGADQVAACIGDESNFEILVDTASLHDGHDAGLELSEASTDLYLIMPDGSKEHLHFDS